MKIEYYMEQSLLGLLKKKPIDEIRATEIIDGVGTCKGTFYKYYRDKYDLLLRSFRNNIYGDIPETSADWREFVARCLSVFEQNAPVILNAFSSSDVNSARHHNERLLRDVLYAERLENGLETGGEVYELAINIFSANITDIIVDWLHTGCKRSHEKLIGVMRDVMPVILCPSPSVAGK